MEIVGELVFHNGHFGTRKLNQIPLLEHQGSLEA